MMPSPLIKRKQLCDVSVQVSFIVGTARNADEHVETAIYCFDFDSSDIPKLITALHNLAIHGDRYIAEAPQS